MLEAFGLSDPGSVRTNNEDYFLLAPSLDLYLVADGMGGAQAGEHASKLAGDTVADFVWSSNERSGDVLLRALAEANRRVIDAAEADPYLHGMGTTMTAAWKLGDEVLIANVGDSRAYVYMGGELHIITEDQTWVNEVGRRFGIGEEQLKGAPHAPHADHGDRREPNTSNSLLRGATRSRVRSSFSAPMDSTGLSRRKRSVRFLPPASH